jgi:hypothetical protein
VSTPQRPPDHAKRSFFLAEKTQKIANFFNTASTSSSSHPDLTFTAKPKQLRAEAKEMVRSLQASTDIYELKNVKTL